MLTSRGSDLQEIIGRLGSRSPARVDAARARLAIIGARAVEALIEALEGDDTRVRARVMPLLALIRDPRGREPLIAMLLDRHSGLRRIAARCLGRFPAPEVVCALERTLQREAQLDVRVAAVQALVQLYAAGQEPAIRSVVELLMNPAQDPEVREAAFGLLPLLRAAQRRSLLERLAQDPQAEIRRNAERLLADGEASGSRPPDLEALLDRLASDDYGVWNEAVQRLAGSGGQVVRPLVAAMQARAHDPEYCARAGMALKALGPRRGRGLADALDEVEEPLVLQVLVEVVGALGEKSLIYRLKDLIERTTAKADPSALPNGFDPLARVRAKAHLELARIGSRVAIEDLRDLLADPCGRVDLEALAAVGLIGKREEIGLLLQAWVREDGFMRERIAGTVRTIMKRERIRRNNRMFVALPPPQRRALEAILPPTPPRRGRRLRTGPTLQP